MHGHPAVLRAQVQRRAAGAGDARRAWRRLRDRLRVRAGAARSGRRASQGRPVQQHRETRAAHPARPSTRGVWRFALDSEGELHKLAAAAPGSAVYVRLDVEDSHSLFPLSRKFGTSADEARPTPEHGTRVRPPPVRPDLPRRLTVHRPVDVLAGDRAMRPGDAAPRAVRDPHRDAEHRRRHAGDLRRSGARHPRRGRRRRAAPSPACRTARRTSRPNRVGSSSPRAACSSRPSSASPVAAASCGRTSTSAGSTA